MNDVDDLPPGVRLRDVVRIDRPLGPVPYELVTVRRIEPGSLIAITVVWWRANGGAWRRR